MNFYQFIIPRLNGKDIEKDFDYYIGLVKKGIAGFIIFGGKLEAVRQGISELQKEAERPLIIAADLERGLGQQLEGGTIFPPAMAIAEAITPPVPPLSKGGIKGGWSSRLKLLRDTFRAVALEAGYAGINTILAPVLDINTNPKNPIISTRAFGEDAEAVSFFGIEMIKALQANGITACGKHFPGHGDTEIDSHICLPVIKKDMQLLEKMELVPFRGAVKAGVKMIMLGHLKVPALDPSGIPVSLSEKAVRYLRDRMGFKGILITDALNMGGIGKYSEEKASLMALRAGVDLLLHPTDPDKIAAYLSTHPHPSLGCESYRLDKGGLRGGRRLRIFRDGLICFPSKSLPDFKSHRKLSEELTKKAIKVSGEIKIKGKPFLVILNDEGNATSTIPLPRGKGVRWRGDDIPSYEKGEGLVKRLKKKFPDLKLQIIKHDSEIQKVIFPDNSFAIVAVFSGIKAWKGGPSPWLLKCIKELEGKAGIFISFGSPYILDRIGDCPRTTPFKSPFFKGEVRTPFFIPPYERGLGGCRIGTVPSVKIYAWWDSESAQKAVAELF